VWGGSGRATVDVDGGAEASSGSSFTAGSARKEEGCERVAELVGSSGSYITSGVAGGTKGFSDNSHWRCLLKLF
jgi:hypothetical protein